MHLPEGRRPVGKKLHPLLAEYHIEGRVGQGERHGVPLLPGDRHTLGRREAPGHREHPWVEFQARDLARGPHVWGREPRDDPSATGHIQDPLAGRGRGQGDQRPRPRRKDGRDQVPFIELSGTRAITCPIHRLTHGGRLPRPWVDTPTARLALLPEAGARQERTLAAVRCGAWFGSVVVKDRFSLGSQSTSHGHSPCDGALVHEGLCAALPRCAGPPLRRVLAGDPRGHGIDATSSDRTNWRHASTNAAG
jgi:hypothetical protein